MLLTGGLLAANPAGAARAITQDEWKAASLFMETSPSVVGIGEVPLRAGSSIGTGFVWDDYHVVTNFHVISELRRPYVTFLSKDASGADEHITVGANIVGADPLSDIAVLQVQTDGEDRYSVPRFMQALPRGVSNSLLPGQEVFALGNPFGLEHSMSKGVISGVSRTMDGQAGWPMSGIIQTDASINPGNSGGPLLNSEGAVIGVNTAILSSSGTFAGVGFALPIDKVQQNVASMIREGYVSRPSLGVELAPDDMTESLGVGGAMITKVFTGSPAQQAGLRAMRKGHLGDVIVSIAGRPISKSQDVFSFLDQKLPGEEIMMSVQRASADVSSDKLDQVDLTVRLGRSNSKLVST
jgi:S1-C subfamily serine protease